MLDDGYIILCDRFIDSTVSYQGYARKQDINQINKLNEIATKGLKPDLTIVFDIESTIAQKGFRAKKTA